MIGHRSVQGNEQWRINPSLVVISYNIGDTRLDLAVLPEDLVTVGKVLDVPAGAVE